MNECICHSLLKTIENRNNIPNRKAICTQCNSELPSVKEILPFFKELPNESKDLFYCGCRGWD